MTHIEMACGACGGRVVFGADNESSSGLGVLARCECGSSYRLAGGVTTSLRPERTRPVVHADD